MFMGLTRPADALRFFMEGLPMERNKPPEEWTDEEAMKRLFPKKVRDLAEEVAHESDEPEGDEPEPDTPE